MTEAQIADLERFSSGPMRRLLSERQALLKALKDLAAVVEHRGACTSPQCLRSYLALGDPYREAERVIVFAEQPVAFT